MSLLCCHLLRPPISSNSLNITHTLEFVYICFDKIRMIYRPMYDKPQVNFANGKLIASSENILNFWTLNSNFVVCIYINNKIVSDKVHLIGFRTYTCIYVSSPPKLCNGVLGIVIKFPTRFRQGMQSDTDNPHFQKI